MMKMAKFCRNCQLLEAFLNLLAEGRKLFGELRGLALHQIHIHAMKQGPVFRLGPEQGLFFFPGGD